MITTSVLLHYPIFKGQDNFVHLLYMMMENFWLFCKICFILSSLLVCEVWRVWEIYIYICICLFIHIYWISCLQERFLLKELNENVWCFRDNGDMGTKSYIGHFIFLIIQGRKWSSIGKEFDWVLWQDQERSGWCGFRQLESFRNH